MKNLLSKSTSILRNNLLFIQPLLLYLLMAMIMLPYIASKNIQIYPKSLLALSLFLLTVAITAGWMYINKKGVLDYNSEDSKEEVANKTIKNFKLFFAGVGEYFPKVLFGYICFFIIYLILFFASMKLCLHFLGEPVIAARLNEFATLTTISEFNALLNTFSANDIQIFKSWIVILSLLGLLFNFLGILYFAVLLFETDNPLISIWKTFVFFIKNILSCFIVMAFMFFIYLMINILAMMLGATTIAFTVLVILITMYLNYYIILVFCFYNERTQDNSNSRTECIGQDSSID